MPGIKDPEFMLEQMEQVGRRMRDDRALSRVSLMQGLRVHARADGAGRWEEESARRFSLVFEVLHQCALLSIRVSSMMQSGAGKYLNSKQAKEALLIPPPTLCTQAMETLARHALQRESTEKASLPALCAHTASEQAQGRGDGAGTEDMDAFVAPTPASAPTLVRAEASNAAAAKNGEGREGLSGVSAWHKLLAPELRGVSGMSVAQVSVSGW